MPPPTREPRTINRRAPVRASRRLPSTPPPRVQIEDVQPLLDCGRYRAKRCVGDTLTASATVFRDGHDLLRAAVRHRGPGASRWRETAMRRLDAHLDGDRWTGSFTVDAVGRWSWQVIAWSDPFATWQEELRRKLQAGQEDIESELSEGAELLRGMLARARAAERQPLADALATISDPSAEPEQRRRAALEESVGAAAGRLGDRAGKACGPLVELDVERERACFGSWYELFPRSWGGLQGVAERVPALAELGFDVLYLPPVHPIGVSRRKGRNDQPTAAPGDPGSPWAIGSSEGGHDAIHPELGTIADFDALVATAREHGMEIAIDYAVQCSADHPWLREHPEWFRSRPDGTLKYAENPPKRYMDIYNFDFDCEDWAGLWQALLDVMMFWVGHGVHIFRVDNPHTKPLAFWEWLIETVRAQAPDVVFLSEAFTRRAMMRALAKAGFSQSYTYFTWKNSSWELREYMHELARPPHSDYLRANLFVNTPDILSEYLQHGGPPAFAARLLLAATLSPSYGIYSGFEHFEATPRREGSEEYLDSEKYEVKERRLDGPLLGLVGRLNDIRRRHPALQRIENLTFLEVENDALLAYAKHSESETLIVVVNVDPHGAQEGVVLVPDELAPAPVFAVEDMLGGERYQWRVGRNYVRLDPAQRAGHVLLAGSR